MWMLAIQWYSVQIQRGLTLNNAIGNASVKANVKENVGAITKIQIWYSFQNICQLRVAKLPLRWRNRSRISVPSLSVSIDDELDKWSGIKGANKYKNKLNKTKNENAGLPLKLESSSLNFWLIEKKSDRTNGCMADEQRPYQRKMKKYVLEDVCFDKYYTAEENSFCSALYCLTIYFSIGTDHIFGFRFFDCTCLLLCNLFPSGWNIILLKVRLTVFFFRSTFNLYLEFFQKPVIGFFLPLFCH